MDTNPCSEMVEDDGAYIYAALAVNSELSGSPEDAETWLRKIPRNRRGDVFIALENLQIKISRLGN